MNTEADNKTRRRKLLFLCNQNRLRSPTAEAVLRDDRKLETRSAGVDADATVVVTREMLEWADLIFVMEKRQRNKIRSRFEDLYQSKRIICLYIPDRYDYMDPELVDLIRKRTFQHL